MNTKSIYHLLVFIGLACLSSFSSVQQQIPDGIFAALKAGNSKELAKFFNANIELVILEKEGVYSKTQAELIVKDFFDKNTPSVTNGFSKLHEGGKDGSRYAIGNLRTDKGNYRVSIFMKSINGSFTIHQLRIEEDDNG